MCWGTVGLAQLETLVDAAAWAGFSALTVPSSVCDVVVRDPKRLHELRARMASAGVSITTVDPLVHGLPGLGSGSGMPHEYRGLLESSVDDCCRYAEKLGARMVNVAHVTGSPTPLPALIDCIGSFSTTLNAHGISVAVEFIPGTGIPDFAAALAIANAVGTGTVGITFDTWHFNRSGGNPYDVDSDDLAAIMSLQINDAPQRSVGGPHVPGAERLMPGEGILPLTSLLNLVLLPGTDLSVGIEVFSAELRRLGPRAAAQRAFEAVNGAVDNVVNSWKAS